MSTQRSGLKELLHRKKYFFVFCGILALVCLGLLVASLPLAERVSSP